MLQIKSSFLTVNLNKLVVLMQLRAEEILNEYYNISYSQFLVLHAVDTLGSPTQQEISSGLGITGAGISKLVEKLVQNQLLCKLVNSKNKRANIITLTDEGKKIIVSALNVLEDEFDKNTNKTDKQAMSEITTKIITNLIKNYGK